MIFDKAPEDFKPASEVVACLIECGEQILLLKRKDKNQYWAQPAGGKDHGETLIQAVLREVLEETGLMMDEKKVAFIKTFFVRYPHKDFSFSVFRYTLARKPKIRLCEEHSEHLWTTPAQALLLNLIPDEDICLKEIYSLAGYQD